MRFEYLMFKFKWENEDLDRSEFEAKALFSWQVAGRRMEHRSGRTHQASKNSIRDPQK